MHLSQFIPQAMKSAEDSPRAQQHGSTAIAGPTTTGSSRNALTPAQTASPLPLPPSIERQLEMATMTQWNMEQAVENLRPCRPMLETELQRLTSILKPSTPAEIRAPLQKLLRHCPLQALSPDDQVLLFRDYAADLAKFPPHMVAQACEDYRLNPANRFFPSAAKLIELADVYRRPLAAKLRAIERLINEMDQPPPRKEDMATAEDWERLRKGIAATQEPTPPPVTMPVTDRTYFEKSQPPANEQLE